MHFSPWDTAQHKAGRHSGNRLNSCLDPQLLPGRAVPRPALDVAQSPLEKPLEGERASHTGAQKVVSSSREPQQGTWLGGCLALEVGQARSRGNLPKLATFTCLICSPMGWTVEIFPRNVRGCASL